MMNYSFDELLGNATTINLIKRSLQNNSFPQFAIFSGVMGTGKSTSAKIAAMSLTCEHPKSGQACLECPSCRANIKAFASNGESPNVKVINVASLLKREDVNSVLHDVFDLEAGLSNQVYLFEEAHALKDIKGAQIAFLPEIDRMPLNTYIIMSTTKSSDLDAELKSRAMEFQFRRLTDKECHALIRKYLLDNNYRDLPGNVENIIVRNCKGIPRDLLKSLEFIITNAVTEEELIDFFQIINDETFLELFLNMNNTDMSLLLDQLNELLSDKAPGTILYEMKSFILRAIFFLEGNITDTFSKNVRDEIKNLFTMTKLMQIADLLNRQKASIGVNDFQLLILQIRSIVTGRTIKDIVASKERVAKTEHEIVKRTAIENSLAEGTQSGNKLTKLTLQRVKTF